MPRIGSTIPLIARTAELSRLSAALDSAVRGDASAVLIGGEAGVGKSRLLSEVACRAAASGALVLTGRCLDFGEGGMPYLPFVEIVAQLGAVDESAVQARPALAPLVPGLELPSARRVPVSLPPGVGKGSVVQDIGQLQLFEAVLGLLVDAAQGRPLVLAIEDVHWAEASTMYLLSFLLGRLAGQRVLVLASYRTDELHRAHPLRPLLAELTRNKAVDRMDLTPLSSVESSALVRTLLVDAGDELSDSLVSDLAARSEGNAFFAEELVAARDGHRLPETLVEVLLSRLERLSAPTLEAVRIAAIGGRWVRHERFVAVAGLCGLAPAELDTALREAIEEHVLVVDGERERYCFRHALLKEAVYGDLLPGERSRLHGKYAEVIEKETGHGVAAALAHHSMECHALVTALSASITAADEADRSGAPVDALHHVERALKLWGAVEAESRPAGATESFLLRNASSLCSASGRLDRAVHYARSAVDTSDAEADPIAGAKSRRRLILALSTMDGTGAERLELTKQGWELIKDTGHDKEKAWILALWATQLRDDDVEQARTIARQAITQAETVGSGAVRAATLVTMGRIEGGDGNIEIAAGHLRAAIAVAADGDAVNTELQARFYLGLNEYEVGELSTAVAQFVEAMDRARVNGLAFSVYGIECRVFLAVASFTVGDWKTSLSTACIGDRGLADVVHARLDAVTLPALIGMGRFEEAQRSVDALASRWGLDWQVAIWAATGAAELASWRGQPDQALRAVRSLLDYLVKVDFPLHTSGIRAAALGLRACADLGDTAEGDRLVAHAERVVAEGIPRLGALGREGLAWLSVVRAEHARLTGIGEVAAWREALAAFDYGELYPQAICRWRLAEALLAEDGRAEAATLVRAALTVTEQLGAEPLRQALLSMDKRARLSAEPAVRPVTGPLTERERAVLELVALGKTNREVGAALYISEKTVSVHLSRTMGKLGAARRAEAVAIAYDRGLL